MQYSPMWSPPVSLVDTPMCNNIDTSIQDIPPVLILDTPACNNHNNSIQAIPSPLSDNVSPQQTPVIVSLTISLIPTSSYTVYCNEGVSFKLNLFFVKANTNNRMEHLISSFQDKNRIARSSVNVSLLEEENLKLQNQIIENYITAKYRMFKIQGMTV